MSHASTPYIKTAPYRDILRGIKVALQVNEGIIKLTGLPGSGKTRLCLELQNELLAEGETVIFIGKPPASAEELQGILRLNLHLENQGDFTRQLSTYLHQNMGAGKRLLLIFDDAEQLGADMLMMIRMLSNIQNDKQSLLHVILSGSPQLDSLLDKHDYRALAQHLSHSFKLTPMQQQELAAFLLEAQGHSATQDARFSKRELAKLFKYSQGLPGLVLEKLANQAALAASARVQQQPAASGDKHGLRTSLVLVAALLLCAGAAFWFYLQSPPPETRQPLAAVTTEIQQPPLSLPQTSPTLVAAVTAPQLSAVTVTAQRMPAPEPLPTPEETPEQQAEAVLSAWLDSWQAQDTGGYLSHYHADFVPAYHDTLEEWRNNRNLRISEPDGIHIAYRDLQVLNSSTDEISLQFWMTYRTATYADETLKEVILRAAGPAWQIVSERNLQLNIID